MHSEWRKEMFLKSIVGDKMRLRFWNKKQKDGPCIHAAGALQLNAWKSSKVSTINTRKFD